MVAIGGKEEGERGGGGRKGAPDGGEDNGRDRRDGGEEIAESRGGTHMEASNWKRVVELVQPEFGEGRLEEEAT